MNDSDLDALDEGLQGFRNGLALTPAWGGQRPMSEALALIRARHGGAARTLDRESIRATVNDYLLSGAVQRRDDVFTLGIGAGWVDEDGKGILANRELRERLFTLAETVTGRPRRLRAFRNLLHAYWTFPLHNDATPPAAIAGWKALRDWLKERHAAFSRHPARKPTWFNALTPHLHLIEDHPCAPYAEALLRDGNLDELQRAIDSLLIPSDSWLKTEAVMAQIDAAVTWPDADFRGVLPALLNLVTGQAGIEVPAGVAQRAIARLVVRYAAQQSDEPHEALFLLAIERIGNPWRQRAAWDALVCDEAGNPSSLAREMVNVWLKDRLIGEFFQDGGQKKSRSDLWQRYSVFVQALSLAAPWVEAHGQALLLRIGEFLVVVPKNRTQPLEAYPWQVCFPGGSARLLDQDRIDGAEIRAVLALVKPARRSGQGAEEALGFFEFVISSKARLHARH